MTGWQQTKSVARAGRRAQIGLGLHRCRNVCSHFTPERERAQQGDGGVNDGVRIMRKRQGCELATVCGYNPTVALQSRGELLIGLRLRDGGAGVVSCIFCLPSFIPTSLIVTPRNIYI